MKVNLLEGRAFIRPVLVVWIAEKQLACGIEGTERLL
jgi:hypothetical protein